MFAVIITESQICYVYQKIYSYYSFLKLHYSEYINVIVVVYATTPRY